MAACLRAAVVACAPILVCSAMAGDGGIWGHWESHHVLTAVFKDRALFKDREHPGTAAGTVVRVHVHACTCTCRSLRGTLKVKPTLHYLIGPYLKVKGNFICLQC